MSKKCCTFADDRKVNQVRRRCKSRSKKYEYYEKQTFTFTIAGGLIQQL